MKVTVVIPAYNEESYLAGCLSCIAQQSLDPSEYEVIVVDNGSTDATSHIVRAAAQTAAFSIRLVSKPKTSISAVRNAGAAQASGEILAFLDADCLPGTDWLEQAVRLAPVSGAWGAHYRVPEDASWVGKIWSTYQGGVTAGPVAYLPGGDLFLRRRDFDQVGGFRESARTSEDVELCSRIQAAGMLVMAMPELAVIHLGTPRTLERFYQQHRWHGQEVLRLFLQNLPSRKNMPLVLLSVYTLLMTCLVGVGAVMALLMHRISLAFLPLVFLVLPPLLIAIRKVLTTRSFACLGQLWVLYLVYFLARAAALRYVMLPATHGGRLKT